MSSLDWRQTPARADLAAKHLEGKVAAPRFVEGELREVIEPQAPLRQTPSPDAPLLTEALMGERISVFDTHEGWAWVQLAADGYVGYLPAAALAPPGPAPTHRVAALRTLVFPGPSIKLPPVATLPLAARVAIVREQEPFAVTASGGYVPKLHLAPVESRESDFVAVAERFIGIPYLWGGKTSLGLDCSGLVQVALTTCGITCPRDSDMQEQALGERVDGGAPRRGDLYFWKGHVAIARDAGTFVHANAHAMAVSLEPIAATLARIGARYGDVTGIKRINRAG